MALEFLKQNKLKLLKLSIRKAVKIFKKLSLRLLREARSPVTFKIVPSYRSAPPACEIFVRTQYGRAKKNQNFEKLSPPPPDSTTPQPGRPDPERRGRRPLPYRRCAASDLQGRPQLVARSEWQYKKSIKIWKYKKFLPLIVDFSNPNIEFIVWFSLWDESNSIKLFDFDYLKLMCTFWYF